MEDTTDTDDASTDLASRWGDVTEQLEVADGDPVETGLAVDAFCDTLAHAVYEDGASTTTADAFCGRLAKLADIKKSKIEETYEKKLSDLRTLEQPESEDGEDVSGHNLGPANFWMQDSLVELIIYDPEDVSVDAKYVWQFENPDIRVETEREHLAPNTMQEAVFVASGSRYSVGAPENLSQNWTDWVFDLIASCKASGMAETRRLDGERSEAVRDIQNQIEGTNATLSLEEAVQQYRPHVESEGANTVTVPKPLIERVMSDYENVNYRDLQVELDERGYRARNNTSETVGRGKTVSLWHFNRDWLDIGVELSEEEGDDAEADDGTDQRDGVEAVEHGESA